MLFVCLQPLVKWPGREELKKTMPSDFRTTFPQCVCIIDCFEVFCERPTDLMGRAQTFSNYKNTITRHRIYLRVGEGECQISI